MGTLIIVILIVVAGIVAVVFLNKALHFLSIRFGWVYWPVMALLSLLLFLLCIPSSGATIVPIVDDNNVISSAWIVAILHFLYFYFLIPMLDGDTNFYFSYTIESHTFSPDEIVEHVNETYTPGWVRKLITQAVGAFICFLIVWLSAFSLLWLIFVLELLYTLYLSTIAILNRFFPKRR
ncbi:MAG: hypothetical protein IJS52_04810 [Bacilli bacterium]|nr:hypothetical protein [Bacilli bacterium]